MLSRFLPWFTWRHGWSPDNGRAQFLESDYSHIKTTYSIRCGTVAYSPMILTRGILIAVVHWTDLSAQCYLVALERLYDAPAYSSHFAVTKSTEGSLSPSGRTGDDGITTVNRLTVKADPQ